MRRSAKPSDARGLSASCFIRHRRIEAAGNGRRGRLGVPAV